MLRECDRLEPLLKRVHGTLSSDMTTLLRRRADALRELNRFAQARAAILESLRITERVSGRGDDYALGLHSLAGICLSEGDFEGGLKYVQEARSLVSADDFWLLSTILNMEAFLLSSLERYQEALLVREKQMELALRIFGPDHLNYATSLLNAANLYAELKQMSSAVDLASKGLAIRTKTFGPSHPSTQRARDNLAEYQKALTDPETNKKIASKSHRMCNIDGCHIVKEKMNRCLKCLSFYLCKEHEGKINEHVVVCPKFPDVLPDEEKLDQIVKCRRCRKQTKLMKCAVCESVSYCGAQCQKEDWKRHKQFCGKK